MSIFVEVGVNARLSEPDSISALKAVLDKNDIFMLLPTCFSQCQFSVVQFDFVIWFIDLTGLK